MLMIGVTGYDLSLRTAAAARKFFVTGVKDLSTGVKYMDSKVVFVGFIRTGVKDLSTGVKYMDSKVEFWFYS